MKKAQLLQIVNTMLKVLGNCVKRAGREYSTTNSKYAQNPITQKAQIKIAITNPYPQSKTRKSSQASEIIKFAADTIMLFSNVLIREFENEALQNGALEVTGFEERTYDEKMCF